MDVGQKPNTYITGRGNPPMRDVHNGRKKFYISPKPTATPYISSTKSKKSLFFTPWVAPKQLFREDGKFSSIYKGCTIFRSKVSVPAQICF